MTRALSGEHDWLLSLLSHAAELAREGDADEARMQALRAICALRSHLQAESRILAPALERAGERGGALAGAMRQDVDAFDAAVQTAEALVDGPREAMEPGLIALRAALLEHARREQDVFLPACDGVLDAGDRIQAVRALGRRFC